MLMSLSLYVSHDRLCEAYTKQKFTGTNNCDVESQQELNLLTVQ